MYPNVVSSQLTSQEDVEPLRLSDFHVTDNLFQPIVKMPKCNLVPLSHSCDTTTRVPVLVQIDGGGVVTKSFGIEDKDQDGKRKRPDVSPDRQSR